MKPILEVRNISKKFNINQEVQPYLSLRDSITNMLKPKNKKQEFWALKDVSFDVMPGDSLGIVGKNGAGKSTLLKILSKITPPTSGYINGNGRVASLLEVGTGFHPELTGRENVFMNGSILGMRRSEIIKNFNDIVEFSGVEKFIDTPLKHYSSGMQLRLAFAVAAFLENEILVIDEVLAVGDAEFQKKCMGKMKDINSEGNRTVLFVSHNISAVQSFCNKALYLKAGTVEAYGDVKEITGLYIQSQKPSEGASTLGHLFKNKRARIESIDFVGEMTNELDQFCFYRSQTLRFKFNMNVMEQGRYNISIHFKTVLNQMICNSYTPVYELEPGIHSFVMEIPSNFLNDEMYKMDLFIVDNASIPIEVVNDIITFEIIDDSERIWFGKFDGVIRPDCITFTKTTV